MIDTLLMYHLLKALPSSSRLIIIGDIDQLPSVGPGNVLKDIISSNRIALTRLTKVFRQGTGSHIASNAHRINQGLFPYLKGEMERSDFVFYEADSPEKVIQTLLHLSQKILPESFGFHPLHDIQILSPMKKGMIGTENLNRLIQQSYNPSSKPLLRGGYAFHIGDKIMQMRNHYQKEVFNGDVGFIEAIDWEDQTLQILFDGRSIAYDFDELEDLALAYAVSIHKYQGSESPCILIPVHTSHFIMLHRNLLYTAITRGKKKVILVGTTKAIAIAIQNNEARKRYTYLEKAFSHLDLLRSTS
jgi:exodeoxyribonuclease V alpha subunit